MQFSDKFCFVDDRLEQTAVFMQFSSNEGFDELTKSIFAREIELDSCCSISKYKVSSPSSAGAHRFVS